MSTAKTAEEIVRDSVRGKGAEAPTAPITRAAGRTPEQIVRDAYEIVERTGDLDAFLEDFHEDAELVESALLPYGGVHKGKAAIRATILRIMGEYWSDFTFTIDSYLGDEEFVICKGQLSATGAKTGIKVNFPITEMWRVTDGKIAWLRPVYGDFAQVHAAIGKP